MSLVTKSLLRQAHKAIIFTVGPGTIILSQLLKLFWDIWPVVFTDSESAVCLILLCLPFLSHRAHLLEPAIIHLVFIYICHLQHDLGEAAFFITIIIIALRSIILRILSALEITIGRLRLSIMNQIITYSR